MERTNQLLSVEELLRATDSFHEVESKILNHGPKSKFPLGTPAEAAAIKSYQDDFRRVISMERIAKRSFRSTAHIEDGLVKIVKRVGKWKKIGSSNLLKWHEALFLMEMNRLELYYDSVIVSLERAYSLALRKSTDAVSCGKLSKEEYAVYSHFMRNGFIIQEHKSESNSTRSNISGKTIHPESCSEIRQCIWSYLFELLGQQQHSSKRLNVQDETYERVKLSMDNTISSFKSQNVNTDSVPRKRKHGEIESTSGESSSASQYFGTEPLNAFMIGDERIRFQKVFDKIDIIQLNVNESAESEPSEALHFSFDLWTNENYNISENSEPNYRCVVQRGNRKDLPNSRDIKNLFQRQVHKCPIILIYVSDEFAFHAYIYRFTT